MNESDLIDSEQIKCKLRRSSLRRTLRRFPIAPEGKIEKVERHANEVVSLTIHRLEGLFMSHLSQLSLWLCYNKKPRSHDRSSIRG